MKNLNIITITKWIILVAGILTLLFLAMNKGLIILFALLIVEIIDRELKK